MPSVRRPPRGRQSAASSGHVQQQAGDRGGKRAAARPSASTATFRGSPPHRARSPARRARVRPPRRRAGGRSRAVIAAAASAASASASGAERAAAAIPGPPATRAERTRRTRGTSRAASTSASRMPSCQRRFRLASRRPASSCPPAVHALSRLVEPGRMTPWQAKSRADSQRGEGRHGNGLAASRRGAAGTRDAGAPPRPPDWGIGQVQSVVGHRVTVNFADAGKVLINAAGGDARAGRGLTPVPPLRRRALDARDCRHRRRRATSREMPEP